MRTLGNILWFILGGWWSALLYLLLGLVCCVTVIGLPIGKALFQYAKLMAFPFGKEIVKETFIKGEENISSARKIGGTIANIVWLPFGICIFAGNIVLMLCCFVSIIFIPVGIVLAKSCKFVIWPIGAKVVSREDVIAIKTANILKSQNPENAKKENSSSASKIDGITKLESRNSSNVPLFDLNKIANSFQNFSVKTMNALPLLTVFFIMFVLSFIGYKFFRSIPWN